MGGNTGNIRTLRNQSGTVGNRTLGSIISSDGINGAGSVRRIYGWYKATYGDTYGFYQNVLGVQRGRFASNNYLAIKYI